MVDRDIFRQITWWLLSKTKESNSWHLKFVSRFRWPHSRGCCCEGARIVHFRCDRCLSSFCIEVSIKINFMVKSFFNCFVMAAAAFHIKLFLWIYLSQNLQSTCFHNFFCMTPSIQLSLIFLEFPGDRPTLPVFYSGGHETSQTMWKKAYTIHFSDFFG